jgi:hypothetical protein
MKEIKEFLDNVFATASKKASTWLISKINKQ